MKIQPRQIDSFVKSPTKEVTAVLVYGPDEGLVRERLDILTKSVVPDLQDPFNIVEFPASVLADNPSRLMDEAKSISMLGGRRAVRLRDAGDGDISILSDLLASLRGGDNFVVVEAGNLGKSSKLRTLFENADNAAAIPCYVDDERDLTRVIADGVRGAGYTISSDALTFMAANVIGDRGVVRSEIDKLITYVGVEKKSIGLEDIVATTGDSAALSLDDLTRHVGLGNFAAAERILSHLLSEGMPAVTILRVLQTHFMKLHLARARVEAGETLESALAKIRPPLFFKVKPAFEAQVRNWPRTVIEQALGLLMEAESRSKQTGYNPTLAVERAVLSLAQIGGRGKK